MAKLKFPHPVIPILTGDERTRLLLQPAVLYCAWIKDQPIEEYWLGPVKWGKGGITCEYIFYNCQGAVCNRGNWGLPFWADIYEKIKSRYDAVKKEITENVPAVKTYIDIRTLEQMQVECCPKQLAYLLQETPKA